MLSNITLDMYSICSWALGIQQSAVFACIHKHGLADNQHMPVRICAYSVRGF